MSSKTKKKRSKTKGRGLRSRLLAPIRMGWRYLRRGLMVAVAIMLVWIIALSVLPVPVTPYMLAERWRLGTPLEREWTPIEEVSPTLQRAVVAAEDANFCLHWGLDIDAIRDAIASGAQRGGSTISQQTVKNTFLWHGRSWFRKALEAALTPVVELFWSKRRILEVYLNIAEFDTGVFGAEAAAQHYFGVDADALSARQAALLAAILPNPQNRSASQPSNAVAQRAASISDGAATIRADGRDMCFAN
ncbi:MAG: monofunctional biosynthetic peptidoglycan transglycosylase [Pseudomonadota bacterium]